MKVQSSNNQIEVFNNNITIGEQPSVILYNDDDNNTNTLNGENENIDNIETTTAL